MTRTERILQHLREGGYQYKHDAVATNHWIEYVFRLESSARSVYVRERRDGDIEVLFVSFTVPGGNVHDGPEKEPTLEDVLTWIDNRL